MGCSQCSRVIDSSKITSELKQASTSRRQGCNGERGILARGGGAGMHRQGVVGASDGLYKMRVLWAHEGTGASVKPVSIGAVAAKKPTNR